MLTRSIFMMIPDFFNGIECNLNRDLPVTFLFLCMGRARDVGRKRATARGERGMADWGGRGYKPLSHAEKKG